jgi:hypothetical protein
LSYIGFKIKLNAAILLSNFNAQFVMKLAEITSEKVTFKIWPGPPGDVLIMKKERELHEWRNKTNEKIIYKDLSFSSNSNFDNCVPGTRGQVLKY